MSVPAHLVLGAGGVRCLAYIGALERLQSVYRFESVSACSAGTLIGALLCAGVAPEAMREEVLARDLREIGGAVRFRKLRQITRRRRWPYALFEEPGIPRVFEEIAGRHGREPAPVLGSLDPPLATAAVDVVSERLLVYSTGTHPDMPVKEALAIATAVPSFYEPYAPEEGRIEVVDAAITSYTPLWLATGREPEAPIVVLRVPAQAQRPPRNGFVGWITEVLQSGVASQDAHALERSAHVTVHDIPADVDAFAFQLDRAAKEELIAKGWETVSTDLEVRDERRLLPRPTPSPGRDRDREAELEGTWRQRRHANEAVRDAPPTVFISYAREDRRFVELLRHHLGGLVGDDRITVWDDSYIGVGQPWEERIADAALRAFVAVLLVSAKFNDSSYIRLTELPLLRKKGMETIWVSLDGELPSDPREQAVQGFRRRDDREPTDPEIDLLLRDAAGEVKRLYRESLGAAPPAAPA
jgi:predicted acylesterase/phospholipase RssA